MLYQQYSVPFFGRGCGFPGTARWILGGRRRVDPPVVPQLGPADPPADLLRFPARVGRAHRVCRHLAWLGAPRSIASLVLEPPCGLLRQSYAPRRQKRGVVNADGWGVGFHDDGRHGAALALAAAAVGRGVVRVAHPDKKRRGEDRRAGRTVAHADSRPPPRIAGGLDQHLQRHERHREREQVDDGSHLRPFRPEDRDDQRLRGRRQPEIEGQGRDHHCARRPQERACGRAVVVLDTRIGGEGDLVQRRHELRDEDLRQEQAGRIDAEQVRAERAARDEHVRLALPEPEQLPSAITLP